MLLVRISGVGDYITFENFIRNRDILKGFVNDHYILSVLGYIIIYISTAFFLPGAIPLTIIGGLLFGVFWGTIYVYIGAISGSALAFFTARYLIGSWIQDKHSNQLRRFNEEMLRHGHYYLILIRLTPIPFFLINYIAGLTMVPFRVFLWTFLVIALPGTIIYTFGGHHMGTIETLQDVLSIETLLILILLSVVFILSLIAFKFIKNIRKG